MPTTTYVVTDRFILQSAVLTIFRKAVELCNILLCGFSPLLVAAVESCMLIYDICRSKN